MPAFSEWEAARDLGGWGVVALIVIFGGRFLGKWFERALAGFEKALETNRRALDRLSEAVDRFASFEKEEEATHRAIVDTQKEIIALLRDLKEG